MEPYTPFLNVAQRESEELKKEASHEQSQSRAPWDGCLELGAYNRSNTAHDIYKLDGEVTKAVMSDCLLNWSTAKKDIKH